MKKAFVIFYVMMLSAMAVAQTQQGYVKTKGRMVNGQIVHGQGLKGATVSIKGRTTVLVNTDDGAFSFPVPEAQFRLDSVRKKGYQLVDMDALGKTYRHSANPLYLVMETPEQRMEEQLDIFERVNNAQQQQIITLRSEIKRLKAENKLTEEEYSRRLSEVADMQIKNQQLVEDMVERYSKIDYDQLTEFDRIIGAYIINGELTKADSLLRTKGDINERIAMFRQHKVLNVKEKEELSQRLEQMELSDNLIVKECEDLANDCYHMFEIFKMQHLNDSAAYYIELRASLDTTNVEWLLEAGDFFCEYLADYDKALNYYQDALQNAQLLFGEMNEKTATSYDNIGIVYCEKDDYSKAMCYHTKALEIREFVFDTIHPDVAASYCNIGYVYDRLGKYETAIEYYKQALEIQTSSVGQNNNAASIILNNIGGSYFYMSDFDNALKFLNTALEIRTRLYLDKNNSEIATSLNNIGFIYLYQGKFSEALEYFIESLQIFTTIFGEEHPNTATLINNIGGVYSNICKYEEALNFFDRSLSIQISIYGDVHQNVARCYNNIAGILDYLGDFDNAIKYYYKALNLDISIFGNNHAEVSTVYNNIGVLYRDHGNYSEALSYFTKALDIDLTLFDEYSVGVADLYANIGLVYYKIGELESALTYFQKALAIRIVIFGEDNAKTIQTKEVFEKVQSEINSQNNEKDN